MDSKVNYTLVGLFVLVLGTALVAVGLWLGATRSEKDYVSYVAYVSESVSGLNTKAAVKYRGVDVGLVRDIALDRDNPERVRLLFDIVRGTPVKQDTVAVLATQGITGLAYIDGRGRQFAFRQTVAAAESAIGLAILVVVFRNRQTINVEDLSSLKG